MCAQSNQTKTSTPKSAARLRAEQLYRFAIHEDRIQAWYQWPVDKPIPPAEEGVIVYSRENPAPQRIRAIMSEWIGKFSVNLLVGRVDRGKAMLLAIMDGDELGCYMLCTDLICYRKYRNIAPGGWMIGPVFTNPEKRRRGYYTKILRHGLHVTRGTDGRNAYGFVSLTNIASRITVEHAGFIPLGVFKTTLRFGRLLVTNTPMPDIPATFTGDAS